MLLSATHSFTARNTSVLIASTTNSACNMVAVDASSPTPASPSLSGGPSAAVIAGGAVAAGLVLAGAAGAVVCYLRRRKARLSTSSYAQLAADPINRA
jgi:hypothetical protein